MPLPSEGRLIRSPFNTRTFATKCFSNTVHFHAMIFNEKCLLSAVQTIWCPSVRGGKEQHSVKLKVFIITS